MSDIIDREPVIVEADKAEDFELNFTLHHPITDEEWDAITDVGLDHTNNIFFHTKNGKEVEFVKRKKGKWKETDDGWDGTYYVCSECGCPWTLIDGTPEDNGMNFCPNCGAYMRTIE